MRYILILFLVQLLPLSINAAIWTVDSVNATGYGSIKAAYDSAANGDTIRFNPSLIANGSDTIYPSSFFWQKSITIIGLYNSQDSLVFSGGEVKRVFDFTGVDTIILDSMIIRDGYSNYEGGGIRFRDVDSVCVKNSFFTNNEARSTGIYSYGGGAVFLNKGSLYLNKVSFKNNFCDTDGGAVYIHPDSTNLFMNKCVFEHNTATNAAGAFFVGITHLGLPHNTNIGKLSIDSCSFKGNYASLNNVGMFQVYMVEAKISNSTFLNNRNDTLVHGNSLWDDGLVKILSEVSGLSHDTLDLEFEMKNCVFSNTINYALGPFFSHFSPSVTFFNRYSARISIDSVQLSNCFSGFEHVNPNAGSKTANISFKNVLANDIKRGGLFYSNSAGGDSLGISFENIHLENCFEGIHLGGENKLNLSLKNCKFKNGHARIWVGQISDSAAINIQNCEFDSLADSLFTILKQRGGALRLWDINKLTLTLSDSCVFTKNMATKQGGAIYIHANDVKFNSHGTQFNGNIIGATPDSSIYYQQRGQAILITGYDHLQLNLDSNIIENHLGGAPVVDLQAAFQSNLSTINIENCFVRNTPNGQAFSNGTYGTFQFHIENSTFTNNEYAFLVLGISGSTVLDNSIINCTFLNNRGNLFDVEGASNVQDTSWFVNNTFVNSPLTVYKSSNPYTFLLKGNVFVRDSTFNAYLPGTSTAYYPLGAAGAMSMGYNAFHDHSQPMSYYDSTDFTNVSLGQSNLDTLGYNGGYTPTCLPLAPSILINNGDPNDFSDAQNGPIYYTREIGAAETCGDLDTQTVVLVNSTSYLWPLDSNVYTGTTNSPNVVFSNQFGCDSIIYLNLIFHNDTSVYDTVYSCGSYAWANGQTYSASQIVVDTFQTIYGADSVVTLDLNIGGPTSGTDVITACNYLYWIDGGFYSANNDTATHTLTNSFGCDSVVTLDLTILNSDTIHSYVTACDSFPFYANTYTTGGHYMSPVFANSLGCDSLEILHLNLNYSTVSFDQVYACNSYTWIDGNTYFTSDSISYVMSNSVGCDSVVKLNLIISNDTIINESVTTCDSFSWSNGQTYYQSQTIVDTFQTTLGCDSIVSLNLTLLNSVVDTVQQFACDVFIGTNGQSYTVSQFLADTFQAVNGCDSILVTDLTINYSSFNFEFMTACDSFLWDNGQTYYTSQTVIDTFQSALGCDSVVSLGLTINNTINTSIAISACDSFLWDNGIVYYSSQTVSDTFQSVLGCDSVVTMTLTISPLTFNNVYTIACDSFLWDNGTVYYTSQTVVDTFQSAMGCDSIVTLGLSIQNSVFSNIAITACDSFIWNNGQVYFVSQTVVDTFPSALGCDSIVSLDLSISHTNITNVSVMACDSFLWDNGIVYYSSQTVLDTFQSVFGCDSVVSLQLAIDTVDVQVYQVGSQLQVQASNAQVRWIDCSTGNIIQNETAATFEPMVSGVYSAEITQNGCVDTSQCFTVNVVGVPMKNGVSSAFIYPNPTSGMVYLKLVSYQSDVEVFITDLSGRMVYQKEIELPLKEENLEINAENWSAGGYNVVIKSKASLIHEKLIIL